MTRLIVVSRNDDFPTLNHSFPPRVSPPSRGHLAPSRIGKRAPLFDATAEQWITPPSGMTPVAGAAADLRHTQAAHTLSFPPLKTRPLAVPRRASGRFHAVVEVLTVALGLTVFGLIAGVFLVFAQMSLRGPYPITNFKARGMAVTLLRIGTKAEFTAPGWTRLQKHIERHEKAGGWVSVERRRLPKPIDVEGYQCVELADVVLAEPI